ncbi:PhoU family transcriptional regulator [Thermosipho melanesiensis]|uniref:Phosphate-specific transport system accessory protein PhoU n=2 Tax=Thermosipho melanesiensis TaxID=46541 RepID=A6LP09_THEM4|nr:phosphate signaling complex protein PhoU [Thermosipho melanesiensis]ABR31660.1 phosphate uptake regulator, PhoU [Thermosipho melanesiensis BI429]APT74687.1 PhoU family transcriptional regulator [Thermosipho melanesiensis]OOC35184.1 PhoU family transcriptional regulator [Thermosipho melanesiensis]OOC35394.1 PhoU family transcriptional regulator [Thermosipho melanesiensis]OOC36645.1 PhoU family transcriptional regulator [Thermosipho melanesiensis]
MESLHFEREYALLKADISKMLSLVSNSFESAVESLEFLDSKGARSVIEKDDEIDQLNRNIEEKIYEIIARYNPQGKDLRYVITMIKFSNNLERIADLSCNIAEKVLYINRNGIKYRIIEEIKEMFGVSLKMLHDTFIAFSKKDLKLLKKIWDDDKKLDDIEIKIREKSKKTLKDIDELILNILIARDLERIGDHLNNLCEEIVYIETGKELKELEL